MGRYRSGLPSLGGTAAGRLSSCRLMRTSPWDPPRKCPAPAQAGFRRRSRSDMASAFHPFELYSSVAAHQQPPSFPVRRDQRCDRNATPIQVPRNSQSRPRPAETRRRRRGERRDQLRARRTSFCRPHQAGRLRLGNHHDRGGHLVRGGRQNSCGA
eukprot:scaffold2252_cov255-Pinguiococcus_pyrenoidosus.AAC.3